MSVVNEAAFFLVIEGLDGSGKSEVSRRLAALVREALDDRVLLTYEPNDPSAAGVFIRDVLTHKTQTTPRALALAYALNRADHTFRVINPFLDEAIDQNQMQRIVICDRYYLSSLVYQSVPPLNMQEVWQMNADARKPDLILFMDASADTCYARQGKRGGERELFDSNLAVRRGHYTQSIAFLRARDHQIVEVDADPDLPNVLGNVIAALKTHGPKWLSGLL
ncbi:MAG: dTMP kinase [Anaerolineae bacterium]|nr:dTMP kinase [Anaerolineae bacterium]